MTSRTLIALSAALVVLALAALYGQRRDSRESPQEGRFFPELEAALGDVDRVEVTGAGGERIATLLRRTDAWVLAEKDDYPADVAKIREALRGLAEAEILEQKTANPAFYDRLGVEPIDSEDAGGVALTAHAGEEALPTVIVGDADGDYRFVRRDDQATSYLVDRELDVPRNAVGWVDPAIIDVEGRRIERVTVEHPDGETLEIFKESESDTNFSVADVPEGRELSYPGVANVVGNVLRDLSLEDVRAAGDASPGEGATRTTFRTFDGLVVTATGIERDDGSWVVFEAGVDPEADPAADEPAGSAAGEADASGETGSAAEPADQAAGSADTTAGETGDAAEPTDDASADGAESAADAAEDAAPTPDPAAEAERVNARLRGWQYKIPSYKFDQMTRRMADLLREEAEAEDE